MDRKASRTSWFGKNITLHITRFVHASESSRADKFAHKKIKKVFVGHHSDIMMLKISENQAFKLNLKSREVLHEHFAVFGSLQP